MSKIIGSKKGWIKIIEAAIAILLVMSVLLIVINKNSTSGKDVSAIYEKELSILREIRLNDTFRDSILAINNESLPIEWSNFSTNGLGDIRTKIELEASDSLNSLDCEAKLCLLGENCVLNENPPGEVYVQSIAIVANLETYSPRQLKLFCWEKPTA